MSYTIRCKRRDGTTEVTRVDGDGESSCVLKPRYTGQPAIVVKEYVPRKAAFNFGNQTGVGLSKQKREAQIREHLEGLRKEYSHSKGFSKGKTMKHIASIPPEFWYSHLAEQGSKVFHDPKEMVRLADTHGFRVSG